MSRQEEKQRLDLKDVWPTFMLLRIKTPALQILSGLKFALQATTNAFYLSAEAYTALCVVKGWALQVQAPVSG